MSNKRLLLPGMYQGPPCKDWDQLILATQGIGSHVPPCCLGAIRHSRGRQEREYARVRLRASADEQAVGVTTEPITREGAAPAAHRPSSLESNCGQE